MHTFFTECLKTGIRFKTIHYFILYIYHVCISQMIWENRFICSFEINVGSTHLLLCFFADIHIHSEVSFYSFCSYSGYIANSHFYFFQGNSFFPVWTRVNNPKFQHRSQMLFSITEKNKGLAFIWDLIGLSVSIPA